VGHPVTYQQQQQTGSRVSLGLHQAAAVRRPGFLATAGTIIREEGPTAFTRGIQVDRGSVLQGVWGGSHTLPGACKIAVGSVTATR
jgi:hypothetical protein